MTEARYQFKSIRYKDLKSKQKEHFNFQKIAALLADYGFNCIKLADDWQSADFLAYHNDGRTTLKVQLKSRLTLDKKYCDKEIWIAFPHKSHWYLVEHDRLLKKVGEHTNWLDSTSWKHKDGYSSTSINPELLKSLEEDIRGSIFGVAPLEGEND